jgi:hypothetical protein
MRNRARRCRREAADARYEAEGTSDAQVRKHLRDLAYSLDRSADTLDKLATLAVQATLMTRQYGGSDQFADRR